MSIDHLPIFKSDTMLRGQLVFEMIVPLTDPIALEIYSGLREEVAGRLLSPWLCYTDNGKNIHAVEIREVTAGPGFLSNLFSVLNQYPQYIKSAVFVQYENLGQIDQVIYPDTVNLASHRVLYASYVAALLAQLSEGCLSLNEASL